MEERAQNRTLLPNKTAVTKNVALRPQKSRKMVIFGKNLQLGKIMWVDRKT